MPLFADWATTAALLAVLLAEGVRRLPAGAIVLRRTLRGSWRIVHGPTVRPEWRLVSIWAPFFEHLVVRAETSGDLLEAAGGGGSTRPAILPSRLTIATFRVAGGAILLIIALVLPAATATHGLGGLARSLALAFLSSAIVAFCGAAYLARLSGWTQALVRAGPMLSPFTAPRCAASS